MTNVLIKSYDKLPCCEREILRYAGVKQSSPDISELLSSCIREADKVISYKVCCLTLPLTAKGDISAIGTMSFKSAALAKCLSGASEAVLFAATLGIDLDRLISRYGILSPSRALMLSAIGSAQIETLCDTFCREAEEAAGKPLTPRFSPGYSDFALSNQAAILSALNCSKNIGMFLSDSLLMTPSKSVTAIAGFCEVAASQNKCSRCNMQGCPYRGEL